jgi:HK97 family phage prohead protease|tara:strand:- start:641 stop:2671 length:2031 start_codon:yes stop_codon:yes gene_type:complete
MEKIFNLTSTFKTLSEDDDGSINIKGYASTNSKDRAGDIVDHDAWTKGGLENFKNNPVILFNHNYDRPIGRATGIGVSDKGLELNARISKSAGDIKELIKDGVLGAFSVGFRVKDADYMSETDGYRIKDAELFEVSVVTVPCNQAATFSIAKSFDNMEEYKKFKHTFSNQANSINSADAVEVEQPKGELSQETEKSMSNDKNITPEFDLEAFAKKVAEDTATKIAMQQAEQKAKAQAETEKSEAVEAEQKAVDQAKQEEQKQVVTSVITGAERLMSDVETRVNQKHEDLEKVVKELESNLIEKSDEIMKMRESKRTFSDRQGNGDWKKAFENDILDAKFAGLATGKGWNTKYAQDVMNKVNTMSGLDVSSADFEQIVSTNVERDIQNELVLAPLFREIQMTSATQILPILPDAGYAEFTGNQVATGSNPHGNLDMRSATYADRAGMAMAERTLSTKKLISQSYLGNETEEDAIMPILPLIRESMVRSHARGIENAILAGDDADGVYGTSGAAFEGLLHLARNDSDLTQTATAFASDSLTALQLLAARKNMGKYGLNPSDVVYIVSQRGYYELLEDAEFQDVNLVGDMATKVSGEIGSVFGSKVIVCDEFATPAVSKFHAIAVYARNYVMPRLRGVTIESDYEVASQRTVLVASQRLGFTDLIDGATSKWALQYKGS